MGKLEFKKWLVERVGKRINPFSHVGAGAGTYGFSAMPVQQPIDKSGLGYIRQAQ